VVPPESALIVEVPEADDLVGRWRLRHDPVAAGGIPAHVTVLYPFVPPAHLTAATIDSLERALAGAAAFRYELTGLGRFPGVLWLRPEPEEPFHELTRRLSRSFPEYPPYGGRHPDSQPHVTVAQIAPSEQDDLARRIEEVIADDLPVPAVASAVSLFVGRDDGTWRREHVVALGSDVA
jgi:2'-5' RNA ligase